MALVGIQNLAANKWQSFTDVPRGFLNASVLGLTPMTAEYLDALETILANAIDDLSTVGVDNDTSTNLRHKRAARYLLRYYAAEAVLSYYELGKYKDVEGSELALYARDLQNWQRMKDEAAEKLNEFIEEVAPRAKSAVWLVEAFEKEGAHDAYKTLQYG